MQGIATQLQAVHRLQDVVSVVLVASGAGNVVDLQSATQELDAVVDYASGMSQQLAKECRTLLHHCQLVVV